MQGSVEGVSRTKDGMSAGECTVIGREEDRGLQRYTGVTSSRVLFRDFSIWAQQLGWRREVKSGGGGGLGPPEHPPRSRPFCMLGIVGIHRIACIFLNK